MQYIKSEKAPNAIGPYSQAVKINNMIFISGQLPIDKKTSKISGESIEEQTGQVMNNIKNILNEAGADFLNVADVLIFLTDLGDFKTVNEIYSTFMQEHKPARATVQVAALPMGAKIEIKMTACL